MNDEPFKVGDDAVVVSRASVSTLHATRVLHLFSESIVGLRGDEAISMVRKLRDAGVISGEAGDAGWPDFCVILG